MGSHVSSTLATIPGEALVLSRAEVKRQREGSFQAWACSVMKRSTESDLFFVSLFKSVLQAD